MIIKIKFEIPNEFDYIKCSRKIDFDISKFDEWLMSDTTHPFWVYENGELMGLQYRADAVTYYINNILYKNNKEIATLIETCTYKHIDYDLLIEL